MKHLRVIARSGACLLLIGTALAAGPTDMAAARRGLCAHLFTGTGTATLAFIRSGEWLVHGINCDAAAVAAARAQAQSNGLCGMVSFDCVPYRRLPYADNIVNLLVIDDFPAAARAGLTPREALRVVSPYGAALFGGVGDGAALTDALAQAGGNAVTGVVWHGAAWLKVLKSYPVAWDEWPQFQHDSMRAAISHDQAVGPPTGVRWISGDLLSHSGEPAELTLSAHGRNFYMTAPQRRGSALRLLQARDAFNGLLLWERMIAVHDAHLDVAVGGERVYAYLATNGPLVALDAGSGAVVKTFGAGRAFALYQGTLVLRDTEDTWSVINPETGAHQQCFRGAWTGGATAPRATPWRAFDPETIALEQVSGALPILIGDGRVFMMEVNQAYRGLTIKEAKARAAAVTNALPLVSLVCLDFNTGAVRWKVPNAALAEFHNYQRGLLFLRSWGRPGAPAALHAYDATNGTHLWSHAALSKKGSPALIAAFYLSNVVWTYDLVPQAADGRYTTTDKAVPDPDNSGQVRKNVGYIGLDPRTGKQVTFDAGVWKDFGRCGPDIAVNGKVFGMDMSVYDLAHGGTRTACYFARGDCGISYIVANGMLYNSANGCVCQPYLTGLMGMTPGPIPNLEELAARAGAPLQPARPATRAAARIASAAFTSTNDCDWPMYRHDRHRSAATAAPVPAGLQVRWRTAAGSQLTPPVAAAGLVCVAAVDEQRVIALDASNGAPRWTYIAGGRVDTPPTLTAGLVLFGARDGWVYCLNAADGTLAWRYRAAPEDRRIVVRGQVESIWPVSGSVLVDNGVAYVTAGRHCDADGGLLFHALDPATGALLWRTRLIAFGAYRTDPLFNDIARRDEVGKGAGSSYNDILSSDGATVFVGTLGVDIATHAVLTTPPGRALFGGRGTFLADNTLPIKTMSVRNLWTLVGEKGVKSWRPNPPANVPQKKSVDGNLLAFDGGMVYGIKHSEYLSQYAKDNSRRMAEVFAIVDDETSATPGTQSRHTAWKTTFAQGNPRLKALLVAHATVVVACQPGGGLLGMETTNAGALLLLSKENGKQTGAVDIGHEPVFDGLAAAGGRVFVSTQDGQVIALW